MGANVSPQDAPHTSQRFHVARYTQPDATRCTAARGRVGQNLEAPVGHGTPELFFSLPDTPGGYAYAT